MDFISFIIGFIIGIMGLSNRIRTIFFRLVMCCITAGFILKSIKVKLYIWHLKDYDKSTNYYAFFHSYLWWLCGLLVIIIYLTFYWIGHFLIEKLITEKMDEKFKQMASNMDEIEVKSISVFMKSFFKRVMAIIVKYRIIIPKEKVKHENANYFEIKNLFSSTFITSIHLLICSFMLNKVFSMNIYFATILIATLLVISIVLFFIVKVTPIFKHLKKIIIDIGFEEYNEIVRKENS